MTVQGALVHVGLSRDEARTLTDAVRGDAERLWRKLVELYEGGAHSALGYSSWAAYFKAVVAAVETWKLDRGQSLTRSLRWAQESWGSTSSALEGHIIRGLGAVAAAYNGEVDDAVLVKKLAKFPGGPGALMGRAKAQREIKGGTVALNVGRIVVDVYNKGRRNGQLAPL